MQISILQSQTRDGFVGPVKDVVVTNEVVLGNGVVVAGIDEVVNNVVVTNVVVTNEIVTNVVGSNVNVSNVVVTNVVVLVTGKVDCVSGVVGLVIDLLVRRVLQSSIEKQSHMFIFCVRPTISLTAA